MVRQFIGQRSFMVPQMAQWLDTMPFLSKARLQRCISRACRPACRLRTWSQRSVLSISFVVSRLTGTTMDMIYSR